MSSKPEELGLKHVYGTYLFSDRTSACGASALGHRVELYAGIAPKQLNHNSRKVGVEIHFNADSWFFPLKASRCKLESFTFQMEEVGLCAPPGFDLLYSL